MKYTTVLFDLDGTLTRSEEGITRSALYAAEKMGFTGFTQAQFKAFIGPPLFESFKTIVGMNDEQADRACTLYRERFSTIGWAENEVYEGIPRLLRSLKKNHVRAAIVTAKPQLFAERIAEKFGFMPYIEGVIGPGFDNKDSSKAALVARGMAQLGGQGVMVGDRCFDIDGGKANGVDTVGVTYGYGSEEELVGAGATHIARDVAELEQVLLGDAPRADGLFFAMEGVDGCGKTTQREALIGHLKQLGWRVSWTREPGGDEIAEKIRALILDPENTQMCPETEAYLYAASRAQNVRKMIRPALERGDALVCDRFVDSSAVYQGGGRQLGIERILELNAYAVDGTKPDAVVYLEMPASAALDRRLESSEPDRLEREQTAFFERVQAAYDVLYRNAGTAVLRIDASGSVEAVTREMLSAVDGRLKELSDRL